MLIEDLRNLGPLHPVTQNPIAQQAPRRRLGLRWGSTKVGLTSVNRIIWVGL